MTKREYAEFCASLPGAVIDRPFEKDFVSWVARHESSRKWFAVVMEKDGRTLINLKCEPAEDELLRSVYAGVVPAYHMNKTHWNTVYPDADVPPEELLRMTENSYRLTGGVWPPR